MISDRLAFILRGRELQKIGHHSKRIMARYDLQSPEYKDNTYSDKMHGKSEASHIYM